MAGNLVQATQVGSLQTSLLTDGETKAQNAEVTGPRLSVNQGWDQSSELPVT